MSTDATGQPHRREQPQRSGDGRFTHREPSIAALARTRPGTGAHAVALIAAGEALLAARRAAGDTSPIVVNPQLLHDAIAHGPAAYRARAKAAGLHRHDGFTAQLDRWSAHHFLAQLSTRIDPDDWPPE